jgi:hypothetical protein
MPKRIVRPLLLAVILVISFSVFGCAVGFRDPYPDYYGYPHYGPDYPHFYEYPRQGGHEREEHREHEHEEHGR